MTPNQQKKIEDLLNRLPVSKDRLEDECAWQAYAFEIAGNLLTEIKAEHAVLTLACSRTKARVELDIRRNPANHGLGDVKVTESSIMSALNLNAEVQAAEDALGVITAEMNRVRAVMNAYDQKRSMLNALVQLFVHNYYASGEAQGSSDKKALSPQEREDLMDRIRRQRGTSIEDLSTEPQSDPMAEPF